MTDKQFNTVFFDAISSPDRDAFVSDWARSTIFAGVSSAPALVEELGDVWDVAHLSVADIRAATGLSQRAFAERHCIPRRSLENWETEGTQARSCPAYVRLLLAEVTGLYHRRRARRR